MIFKRKFSKIIELIILCCCVLVIDFIFIETPIFYNSNFIIYWLIPILFTLIYGKKWVYISLIFSILTMFSSLIIYYFIFKYSEKVFELNMYLENLPISLAVLLLVLYVISIMLSRYTIQISNLKKRVKVLSLESLHFKRSTKALEIVNSEFESQISKSQDSITKLYNQVKKLNKLNSDYIIQTFLETIQQFTKATKAVVWEYDESEARLNLVRSIGYGKDEPAPFMDINGTIEGYVFRNNQFFSIRKIEQFQSILIHQAKKNIMTIPINLSRRVWGVLNIEDIPFENYSRYCEQLIQIIVNLTETPLEKALDFELMLKHNDLDKGTGLPLYSQFYSLLEDKLKLSWKEGHSLSIIIFDLMNLQELGESHSKTDVMKLFSETLVSIFSNSNHDFFFFKYKGKSQLSLISSNLDQDGISFYLVKLYKALSGSSYFLNDTNISFEVAVGYGTQKDQEISADSLLKEAETLLDMSKL